MRRARVVAAGLPAILAWALTGCAGAGTGDAGVTSPTTTVASPSPPTSSPSPAVDARTFLVRDWQRIDATMDNTGAVERVDGDPARAETAGRVREEGWRAIDAHPDAGAGRVGWPPDESELTIRLDAPTWAFVVEELRRWGDVEQGLLDRASSPADLAQWHEAVRWNAGMVAALESGSPTPRSGA
jgi:hypothetical protein